MANILIIDDNKAASAYLKLTLLRQDHKISRSMDIQDAVNPVDGVFPDLVLINHAYNDYSGWKTFDYLKQIVPNLAAVVYMLEELIISNTEWIGKSVQQVISEIKYDSSNPQYFGT